ncbi:DUF4238 domain-containing protein [Actinoplanes philippinensis]|uniref:DUF4238 domain-containing protein n=1 Tax=Actinoplanes philippinensis TaxID=35752 RepID=UPI00341151A1
MTGWNIPDGEPPEAALARIQELQNRIEPHVSNQHVVSRAILKGFAAPGPNGKGWHLVPFDVRRKVAKKPLGLRGCAKSVDFLTVASDSAEKIWKQIEDYIPDVVTAVREGHLQPTGPLAVAARDCLALHLIRSLRFMEVHEKSVTTTVANFAPFIVNQHPEVFVREFRKRHGGLLPAGRSSLESMVQPYVDDWMTLHERGLTARASMESMLQRVRATLGPLHLQIWRTPPGKEFLISDSPCLTLQYQDGDRFIKPHIAIGDAHTVAMPISNDCLLSVGPETSDEVFTEWNVDLFNRLQLMSAYEHVYYRPGSSLANWIAAYYKQLERPIPR